jgi:RHS repeat-associated protein
VQSGTANYTTSNKSSITVTLPANVKAGDTLILMVADNPLSTIPKVSTVTGGGVTWVRGANGGTNAAGDDEVWYGVNSTGGSGTTTITATMTAGTDTLAAYAAEFSGVATTSPLDTSGTASGTGKTAASPTLTTTTAGDLVFETSNLFDTVSGSPTGPWADINGPSSSGNQYFNPMAFQEDPTTGAISTSWSQATSVAWATAAIALKAANPGGNYTLTYDTIGDQTQGPNPSGAVATYQYNQTGQMATATTGGATSTYAYNGDGLETAATTGGVTNQLTWNTNTSLPLILTDSVNAYVYGPSGTPVEQIALATSTSTYLTYTASNDTLVSTNQAGDETGYWGYDAYGTLAFGTPTSPFGYSGQYADVTTGLVNDRARWYQPQTGSFTSRDPAFAATDTAYTYSRGDPVDNSDPSGLCLLGDGINCAGLPIGGGRTASPQCTSASGPGYWVGTGVPTIPITVSDETPPIDAGWFEVTVIIAATLSGPNSAQYLTVNPLDLSADVSVPPVDTSVSLTDAQVEWSATALILQRNDIDVGGDTLDVDATLGVGPPPPRPPAGGLSLGELLKPFEIIIGVVAGAECVLANRAQCPTPSHG